MDKAIAKELMQFAATRQAKEHATWLNLPKNTPEKQWESQRASVAAWATAVQELYALAHSQEQLGMRPRSDML